MIFWFIMSMNVKPLALGALDVREFVIPDCSDICK